MAAKLTASLREAPATAPALAALALFVVWATDQAGYPLTHWAPGGLIVLALAGIAAVFVRLAPSRPGAAVLVALGCLVAYTALSYLSILWAGVPGDAWEGADRTLLYLLVFALFAWWPQRAEGAAMLVGLWTGAIVVLAAVTALHVAGAGEASLHAMFPGGRFDHPTGYPNANAAQWLMAFWPALLLARSDRLHWSLRGLLAGGAVLLAQVALLSQSRGSLYATPIVAILVFALVPGRRRTFALALPIAAGIAAGAPAVLRVGDHLSSGEVTRGNVHAALAAIGLAAGAVAAVVAIGAAVESRLQLSGGARAAIGRGVGALAAACLAGVVAIALVAAGDPVARVEHAWNSFKGGYAGSATGSRLSSGLGSNRYDFYRVALDEFSSHPLAGIGADNFQQQYLARGRSDETPRYPHSVELRTLSQTGTIGALLALAGVAAALVAAWGAMRAADRLAGSVAAAALAAFGYWAVHGSVDWFWEFAGLGAPAFAMLGVVCSLAPRPPAPAPARRRRLPLRPAAAAPSRALRSPASVALVVGALACAVSLTLPWLSQLQVQSAARVWAADRNAAYARLREAADLNPLSDEPYLVAGSIALRYGELTRADGEFARALARTPGDAYATLERGAIASAAGRRARALSLLRRAVRLDPRDEVARTALATAMSGRRVDLEQMNRSIFQKARQLG